jgi:hypothetical protein
MHDSSSNAALPNKAASDFMLQEHSRIIDAYHDLYAQKNELIKFYLTFVSLPTSIVAIFLSLSKYVDTQSGSMTQILEVAGVYLSILLVFVGIAVLHVMLGIRGEQYLYIKTINGARQYFKDKFDINEKYLVLPTSVNEFRFGGPEIGKRWWKAGRAFWEMMIVGATTSMLLAFLAFELARRFCGRASCSLVAFVAVFIVGAVAHVMFVRNRLRDMLEENELIDASGVDNSTTRS